ncbi:MAG: sigma-70 family RNA polymerase sigma factor [Pseudomonadota bacterium]
MKNSNWVDMMERVSAARDQEAFLLLYDYFAPRVASYLQRLGAERAIVEELTQETLLAVWRKAHLYKSERAAVSTWIFTIARNQYIDAVRRQGPVTETLDHYDEIDQVSTDAQLQDTRAIQRAIESLPVMQAQVLLKSYYEGMSHSEIASELNIPLGSVKSNIRLAFQKMQARLRPTS